MPQEIPDLTNSLDPRPAIEAYVKKLGLETDSKQITGREGRNLEKYIVSGHARGHNVILTFDYGTQEDNTYKISFEIDGKPSQKSGVLDVVKFKNGEKALDADGRKAFDALKSQMDTPKQGWRPTVDVENKPFPPSAPTPKNDQPVNQETDYRLYFVAEKRTQEKPNTPDVERGRIVITTPKGKIIHDSPYISGGHGKGPAPTDQIQCFTLKTGAIEDFNTIGKHSRKLPGLRIDDTCLAKTGRDRLLIHPERLNNPANGNEPDPVGTFGCFGIPAEEQVLSKINLNQWPANKEHGWNHFEAIWRELHARDLAPKTLDVLSSEDYMKLKAGQQKEKERSNVPSTLMEGNHHLVQAFEKFKQGDAASRVPATATIKTPESELANALLAGNKTPPSNGTSIPHKPRLPNDNDMGIA